MLIGFFTKNSSFDFKPRRAFDCAALNLILYSVHSVLHTALLHPVLGAALLHSAHTAHHLIGNGFVQCAIYVDRTAVLLSGSVIIKG